MLDDKHYVDRIDSNNALEVAANQPAQLSHEFDFEIEAKEYTNVVFAGMGGSALAAGIFNDWQHDDLVVPFEIVRDYSLPGYVGEDSLVICASYSGNTEETLACFTAAVEQGASVVALSKGGELKKLAEQSGATFIELPDGYQPRMAAWYMLKAIVDLAERINLVTRASDELVGAEGLLFAAASEWEMESPTTNNHAKQLAEKLMGKAVWIYSSGRLRSAAYKWKIGFNENAKSLASYNELPEFNHNEFLGWTSHPIEKPFGVVELTSHLDHPQVQKRFELSNRLLSGQMPAPISIEAKGQNRIEQLLWSCLLGDFVTIYSGILNGVNPTKVEKIEELKKQL